MTSIGVVPWSLDFFAVLADHLLCGHGPDLSRVRVVFPHRRPKRYLIRALAAHPGFAAPGRAPLIQTMGDFFRETAEAAVGPPKRLAGPLDRIGLLFAVLARLAGEGLDLSPLPTKRLDGFFPWGRRLDDLFEETFRQGVAPGDMLYPGDDLIPSARALLSRLGTIRAAYLGELTRRGWTTPGLIPAIAAANSETAMTILGQEKILACGFHILTGCEETFLRALWREGKAEIIWHGDPALAGAGERPHWSCDKHRAWLTRWKAKAILLADAPPPRQPEVRFVEGYDLHSQLAALRDDLLNALPGPSRAVVIADPGLLAPLLHHLPDPEVNVSMGYPLSRTPLAQLLTAIFAAQRSKLPGTGLTYWRDLIALIRHPYLKMLGDAPALPLRPLLHALEASARSGGKHLDPLAWTPPDDPQADPERYAQALTLTRRILAVCLEGFAHCHTLAGLAEALADLSGLLLDENLRGQIWERFVIDAEALSRLAGSIIPGLRGALIAPEPFGQEAVFAVAEEMIAGEFIPFEADPLTGLQILGPLETRLLRFDEVYVLDAVDEKLPGPPGIDHLAPDALRREIGLPDSLERDHAAAHTFFALLAGAKKAVMYYDSGTSGGAGLEEKRSRSRFIEELVFAEETRLGKLLGPGEAPVGLLVPDVRGARDDHPPLTVSPAMAKRLRQRLEEKPVSASFIDAYLACPERFFYAYLTPLEEPEEVKEEGDPLALGDLVHQTLKEFFAPCKGQAVQGGDRAATELTELYLEKLRAAPVYRQSPLDLKLLMERFGTRHLHAYGLSFPQTTVALLEHKISATAILGGREQRLTGIIDRVDVSPEGTLILDYKTGNVDKPATALLASDTDWDNLALTRDQFESTAKAASSLQLPFYAYLCSLTGEQSPPANALYVALREDGKQYPLFTAKTTPEQRQHIIRVGTPGLIGYALRHMTHTPVFWARPSTRCRYCAYVRICSAAPAGE